MRRIDLAERLRLTPSGVTRLLDGLEEAGLTGRRDCPSDARVTYSVITDDGREMLRLASCTHAAVCEELIGAHLSPAELDELVCAARTAARRRRMRRRRLLGRNPGDRLTPDARAPHDGPHPVAGSEASQSASSRASAAERSRSGARTSGRTGTPCARENALHRRLPREALDGRSECRERIRTCCASARATTAATRSGNADASAETAPIAPPSMPRRMSASGPTKTSSPSSARYGSNASHGASLTFSPTKFGASLPQAAEYVERDGIPARLRELVDVERQRRTSIRSGDEVRELGRLVEHEVRRADHGDRRRARLRGVRGERDRVRRRLRAAVRRDVETSGCGLDEQAKPALPLLDREEHALSVRPEGENAVEACSDVPVEERAERVVVEVASAGEKWRHRGGERPAEQSVVRHTRTLDCRDMDALRIERDDDCSGSRSPAPSREMHSTRR